MDEQIDATLVIEALRQQLSDVSMQLALTQARLAALVKASE